MGLGISGGNRWWERLPGCQCVTNPSLVVPKDSPIYPKNPGFLSGNPFLGMGCFDHQVSGFFPGNSHESWNYGKNGWNPSTFKVQVKDEIHRGWNINKRATWRFCCNLWTGVTMATRPDRTNNGSSPDADSLPMRLQEKWVSGKEKRHSSDFCSSGTQRAQFHVFFFRRNP